MESHQTQKTTTLGLLFSPPASLGGGTRGGYDVMINYDALERERRRLDFCQYRLQVVFLNNTLNY